MPTLRFVRPALLAMLFACGACRTDTQGRGLDGGVPESVTVVSESPLALASAPIEPRFQPALEALDAAVNAGDDRTARAVLARLFAQDPTGPALDMANAYERILDGREAVDAILLKLDARFERGENGPSKVGLDFTAASHDGRSFEVRPGPGTMHVRVTSFDERGDETRSIEAVPIDTIGALPVSKGDPTRIPLVEMPFALARGALATRALFDLDLRSGAVRLAPTRGADETDAAYADRLVATRELPAMRLEVEGTEVTVLARELASLPLARPEDLVALLADGTCDRREALRVAVRVPRTDRAAALDALAREHATLPEPALGNLAPALRWLAPEENLGEDTAAWRAWLRVRARRDAPREDLRLPRPRPAPGG